MSNLTSKAIFSITLSLLFMAGLAIATSPILPSNILSYVPINIINSQTAAFPFNGQLMLSINSLMYQQYEANGLQNVEFFYQNGTVIPSWLEGNILNETQSYNLNSSSNTIYWLRLPSNFLPASSSNMLFMGFAQVNINLFNGNVVGEAPQLNSQYAEYDNGANVFTFYDNFNENILGSQWTPTYSSGYTLSNGLSMNAGAVYSTNTLFNSLSDTLEVLFAYTATSGDSQSGLIQGTGTALSGSDVLYNLDQHAGSIQQQVYAGTGGSDSNLINGVLSGFTPSLNQYFVSTQMMYGSTIKSEFNYGNSVSEPSSNWNSPSYIILGAWGGSTSGSTTIYPVIYKWVRTRLTPPNGAMPSTITDTLCTTSGCQPTLNFTRTVTYGNTISLSSTSGYLSGNTVSIIISGGIFGNSNTVATGVGSVTYTLPVEAAGSYTINAFNQNSLLSTVKTLVIQKATPQITLHGFPNDFFYTGSSSTAITANIISYNNQLPANVFINGVAFNSFYTQNIFTLGPTPGSYSVTVNTIGNVNYTSASIFNSLYICPKPTLPQGIAHYACIGLNNYLNTSIPSNTQLMVTVNALAYFPYETNSLNNTELFYQNGTIAYSWMEGNSLNELQTSELSSSNSILFWFKAPPSNTFLQSRSANAIYLGFAENSVILMNNVTTGEAPQLSPLYAEYDNGASVFNLYWDWKGQILPPNWDAYSGVSPSSNNGLTITTTSSDAGYLYEGSSPSLPFIYELYGEGKTKTLFNLDYGPAYINVLYGTNFGNKGSIGGPWIWGTSPYNWEIFSNGTNYNNGVTPSPQLNTFYLLGEGGNNTNSYWAINYNKVNGTALAPASGDYIGFWMDDSATSFAYWGRTRYFLPNDAQPTSQLTTLQSASIVLSVSPSNQITYGSNATLSSSCSPNTDTCQVWEEGGNAYLSSGIGSASYTVPILGAGNYYYYANDITSSETSNIAILTVDKAKPNVSLPFFPSDHTYNGIASQITANIITLYNQVTANVYANNVIESSFDTQNVFSEASAGLYSVVVNSLATGNYLASSNAMILNISKATPQLSLLSFPNDFFYTGSSSTAITANIISYNNQLPANIFINSVSFNSFYTQNTFALGPAGGSYVVTVNTLGNVNYTSATTTNVLYICPVPTIPTGITHYICISFKNMEQRLFPSNTPINFTFNALAYSSYESNSINNTELFYQNGTIADSWIEGNLLNEGWSSNTLSSSANVLIWFKPKAQFYLASQSANAIYLGFASTSTNLFNSNTTGEAPQLSPSYGEYDDGANVFSSYWDFNGNTLPSGLTYYTSVGTTYANNGLFVTSSTSATAGENGAAILASSGVAAPNIIEFYGRTPLLSSDPGWGWIQIGLSNYIGSIESAPANGGAHMLTVLETGLPGSFIASGITSFGGTINWGTLANNDNYIPYTSNGVFSFFFNSNNYYSTLNYTKPLVNVTSTAYQITPLPFVLMLGNNVGASAALSAYWLRIRPFLTSGNTITYSFSHIQSAYTSTTTPTLSSCPSSAKLDVGQSVSCTASWTEGTSPYTVNWLVSNSVTDAITANMLFPSISTTSNTFTYTTVSADPFNSPLQFNVLITDSHPTTVNSVYSSTFTVDPSFSAISTSASPSTIDIGQSSSISLSWSGGTPDYTIKYYSGSSPSCASDTILVATHSGISSANDLLTVTPSSSSYYCASITDSATSPSSVTSNTVFISVQAASSASGSPGLPQHYTLLNDNLNATTQSINPVFKVLITNAAGTIVINSYSYYQNQLPATVITSSSDELNLSFACSLTLGKENYTYTGVAYGLGFEPCGINYIAYGGTFEPIYAIQKPQAKVNNTSGNTSTIASTSTTTSTTSTTTLSTSSASTTISTTVPNTNSIILDVNLNISRSTPQISFSTHNEVFTIFATSNVPIEANMTVVNNTIASPDIPGLTKLLSFTLSVSTNEAAVNSTVDYPCSIPPNDIAPYMFLNKAWTKETNFVINPSGCTISFSVPHNVTVGIFTSYAGQTNSTKQEITATAGSQSIVMQPGFWVSAFTAFSIVVILIAKLLFRNLGIGSSKEK